MTDCFNRLELDFFDVKKTAKTKDSKIRGGCSTRALLCVELQQLTAVSALQGCPLLNNKQSQLMSPRTLAVF